MFHPWYCWENTSAPLRAWISGVKKTGILQTLLGQGACGHPFLAAPEMETRLCTFRHLYCYQHKCRSRYKGRGLVSLIIRLVAEVIRTRPPPALTGIVQAFFPIDTQSLCSRKNNFLNFARSILLLWKSRRSICKIKKHPSLYSSQKRLF
jgi:hypothetical protein